MGIAEYLYDSGCEITALKDNCEFDIIDVKVAELITSYYTIHNRL